MLWVWWQWAINRELDMVTGMAGEGWPWVVSGGMSMEIHTCGNNENEWVGGERHEEIG